MRSWPAVAAAVALLAGCGVAADVADSAGSAQPADPTAAPPADSAPGPDEPTTGEETGSGSSRLRLPNDVGPVPVFLTPSRNIGCAITEDSVRCDILQRSYDLPPRPPDCDGRWGRSIAVGRSGIAEFLCVQDTVVDPDAPVLEYGTSTEVGDFGCASSEQNISCYYLEDQHGFELSREAPAVF